MRTELIGALLAGALLAGCREPDAPLGNGAVFVSSEPQGGAILINGEDTGQVTPDTVHGLSGREQVSVQRDIGGVTYGFRTEVLVSPDEVITIHGPLMAVCTDVGSTSCNRLLSYHTGAGLRFSTSATGALFMGGNEGNDGLVAPADATDRYGAAGMPIFAGRIGTTPVATHVYDQEYAIGLPALSRTQAGGTLRLEQRMWIGPPSTQQALVTPRGLEVRERIIASDATPDVLLVELRYRNVTTDPLYRTVDAGVPEGGITYTGAYIGLALDPDIGDGNEDQASYLPALDAVFTYDASFLELNFGAANAPRLVGLRVLEAPPGTGVVLNTWERQQGHDWNAGTATQQGGYGMISGTLVFTPDYPGTQIGHLPAQQNDARILATAGPLTLAPGDSAVIVLAVALAPPVPDTYTSGQDVPPGDPASTTRPLYAVAATLRERLAAAEALLTLLP